MRDAMSRLLSQAERLDELPLEGVEPTTHGLVMPLLRRLDEVRPGLTQEEALANAPRQAQGHFVVPQGPLIVKIKDVPGKKPIILPCHQRDRPRTRRRR